MEKYLISHTEAPISIRKRTKCFDVNEKICEKIFLEEKLNHEDLLVSMKIHTNLKYVPKPHQVYSNWTSVSDL
jgi:hypothetical protein